MRILLLLVISLPSFQLFAQLERANIITKKILAITTTYWTPDSSRKVETKDYYTIQGDDSLEYYGGKLTFKYKTNLSGNGKVKSVERATAYDKVDEWHMYEYKKDGSYSIEIIAHGAGTIIFSKYDKHHKCLEQTFSSIETLHYEYDDAGRLKRILYNEEKNNPVEVATVVYNNEGLIEKITGTEGKTRFYSYNKFGLVSEETRLGKDENGKEEKLIIYYEYEFRE